MKTSRKVGGFTLVELLVVVAIIGILVAILLPALYAAFSMSVQARDKAELVQLAQGIEAFRAKYGSFPPDFSDNDRVSRFFRKAFPRATEAPPTNLTRAQALVFWLNGFSPDPQLPLTGTGDRQSFYQFDTSRLKSDPAPSAVGGYAMFTPRDTNAPYVYFEAGTYNTSNNSYIAGGSAKGAARPYFRSGTNKVYCNEKSFQLLSAGRDDDFGSHASSGADTDWPTGATNFTAADRDNVTNFSEKPTIGDDLP